MQNLYVKLTNQMGSTVDPPTIVQSSVLLAVGNTSSQPRLKQLAKTITGSHSRNLGLNNTVFGRVKQVHLSSILQHSLHGGDGTATSWSPSPAPVPQPHSHHAHHPHHHHPHHHHPHHGGVHLAPSSAPAPEKSFAPSAPPKRSGCQNGNKGIGRSHFGPAAAPVAAPPEYSAASPNVHVVPPPPVYHQIPASSPLPNVAFSKAQPPSKGVSDEKPTDVTPSPSPLSSSCELHSFLLLRFEVMQSSNIICFIIIGTTVHAKKDIWVFLNVLQLSLTVKEMSFLVQLLFAGRTIEVLFLLCAPFGSIAEDWNYLFCQGCRTDRLCKRSSRSEQF